MTTVTEVMWDFDDPYVMTLNAQMGHIDAMGHVNNGAYVHWCEAVALKHAALLGYSAELFRKLNCGFVIKRSEYDYLQAAVRGDDITIATWITACDGRLSVMRNFQAVRSRDGKTLLRACWTLNTVNIDTGRPTRMPKEFSDIYGACVVGSDRHHGSLNF